MVEIQSKGSSNKIIGAIKTQKLINHEKMDRRTFWAYIAATPGWPLSFYLTYMYFNQTLKVDYGYTSEDVIFHNFLLSIVSLIIIITIVPTTIVTIYELKFHCIVKRSVKSSKKVQLEYPSTQSSNALRSPLIVPM